MHQGNARGDFINCSCDDCSRSAAAAWMGLMDLVYEGRLTLDQANGAADATPGITLRG
jgi:hypothetical protein